MLDRKDADFFYLPRESEESIAGTVVDLVQNRLPRSYGDDVCDKIQVLTPSRKGISGADNLNVMLQGALNPWASFKKERRYRDIVFREGDRVMQMKNNYSLEWQSDDGKNGIGIFNGDIGIISDIDGEDGSLTVDFDDRRCLGCV